MTSDDLAGRRAAATRWFQDLQTRLISAFEAIEEEAPEKLYSGPPGRFERKPWTRPEGGGGTMGLLRGRVFEKAGVHVSAVHGVFTPEMARTMPGAEEDPRFFAAGVSVIVHPLNPRMPTGHMNTRFIATTTSWYGGGGDLTPWLEDQRRADAPDALHFHQAMKAACDRHGPEWYPRYKEDCDSYFHLPHRQEARGVGGVFFDRRATGDPDQDFTFAKDVGAAFLDAYPTICRRRLSEAWSETEREEQLIRRGRYVEYNLLYDRGTLFGLRTGGNIEAILSSMPPLVKWP